MPVILAVLVYLAAFGVPIYLLHRCHAQHWTWHVLAVAVAVGLGLAPAPPQLISPGFDLCFGFVFYRAGRLGRGRTDALQHARASREARLSPLQCWFHAPALACT